MTDENADSPAAYRHVVGPQSREVWRLPRRVPFRNQAMATAVGLWVERPDPDTLERVADGLRDLHSPDRTQHEIDKVIARWRAGHPRRAQG